MGWADLTRERVSCNPNTKQIIDEWDEKFGGYEHIRDKILPDIYSPYQFELVFPECGYIINSTVHRYHVIKHLLSVGALDIKNLRGDVLDIGSFLGAAVDALSAFGGNVSGADDGRHSHDSLGGKNIRYFDGKSVLREYYYPPRKLGLVSFFNVDCDHRDGTIVDWCIDALPALNKKGQILLTFSVSYLKEQEGILESMPDSYITELPDFLSEREHYAFTARKPRIETPVACEIYSPKAENWEPKTVTHKPISRARACIR